MALIGASFGFDVLVSISPKPFESVAKYKSSLEENPQETILKAYYFKGSKSKLRDWTEKRRILLTADNTAVELTDAEINAWIADKLQKQRFYFSGEDSDSKAYIVVGLPNIFTSVDEGIHFSLPLEIITFEKQVNFLLIGQGYFSENDPAKFRLSQLRLNEALIPFTEKQLYSYILNPLLESCYESDELVAVKEAWKKVDTVELTENGVRLNLD